MKTQRIVLFGLLFITIFTHPLRSVEKSDRKLLAQTYSLEQLKNIIIPRQEWHPYPTYANPAGLEQIPARVRKAFIDRGVKALNATWAPLPATVFLDFVRTGNRSRYERLSFDRRRQLANLVMAEVFERQGRFTDQIVNGIWAICEESFWGVPAHLGGQKAGHGLPDVTDPYVDLFAAETGVLLAWTYYLLAPELDKINPLITRRILYEIDRRILSPYLEHEDWGWMGFRSRKSGYKYRVNNWNPWINSNVIACALLAEQDENRRLELLHKAMDSVDNFMAPYPADGGCDEGPSYWSRAGGSLYDCLELLYNASNGAIDIFDTPLIKEIARYIYRAYISDPYFINFADAPAKMRIEPALVYRFGKAIGDETMTGFASFEARLSDFGSGYISAHFGLLNRQLPALFCLNELLATPAAEPLLRDVWWPDIQVMAARSRAGSTKGFYIAAKGGHNDESHNHNDVGNFILYLNGNPVLIDAGAQTYTRKTFSKQRYELWNNQSAYHNLPTINGVMQHQGRRFAARDVRYRAGAGQAVFSLDIAGAYPEEAGVDSWVRTITLNRGKNVTIEENYRLRDFVRPFTLSLMTPLDADVSEPGRIKLTLSKNEAVLIQYDRKKFTAGVEKIEIKDARMAQSWGDCLYRILLKYQQDEKIGKLRLVIDKTSLEE